MGKSGVDIHRERVCDRKCDYCEQRWMKQTNRIVNAVTKDSSKDGYNGYCYNRTPDVLGALCDLGLARRFLLFLSLRCEGIECDALTGSGGSPCLYDLPTTFLGRSSFRFEHP